MYIHRIPAKKMLKRYGSSSIYRLLRSSWHALERRFDTLSTTLSRSFDCVKSRGAHFRTRGGGFRIACGYCESILRGVIAVNCFDARLPSSRSFIKHQWDFSWCICCRTIYIAKHSAIRHSWFYPRNRLWWSERFFLKAIYFRMALLMSQLLFLSSVNRRMQFY